MSDIELYDSSPEEYEDLQLRRPDYVQSIVEFRKLAKKYLIDKENIVIADFCCGTGKNTALLAQDLNINKAWLIDINKDFLEIAQKRGIQSVVIPISGDIINVELTCDCDAVISMFAYHHIKDEQKIVYLEQVKSALKTNGILFLGEIYSPDSETTVGYYNKLLSEIGDNSRIDELRKFLMETAKSDNFEFKVSKDFANKQLANSGFVLEEDVKIWPLDNEFDSNIGMFVEVWRLTV